MSYALSTTKRKFHRILDSISNTSSTSLARNHDSNASTTTLPANLESPSKRIRVARPQSAYIPSASPIDSEHPQKVRGSPKLAKSTAPSEAQTKPHFTPWDRGRFLERLKTFRHVDKWMSKPDKINEVQWAKRGWICVGKERVYCSGCGREVVVQLESEHSEIDSGEGNGNHDESEEDDWRAAAQEQLVEKYAEMITTEHEEGCLWRVRGCDATIYRLPLTHPPTSLDELHQRYISLARIAQELPTSLSTPEKLDLELVSEQVLSTLQEPYAVGADIQFRNPINTQALSLALFGWQAETDHISGLATCNACFRRLGLWLFTSKPSLDEGVDYEEAVMSRLDVAGEHRDYCPWVNATSQSGGTQDGDTVVQKLAGWEILSQVIRNAHRAQGQRVQSSSTLSTSVQDDRVNEAGSIATTFAEPETREARDAKDKERWAKLKRLKQVFRVKRAKGAGKENLGSVRPSTAG